MLEEVTTLPNGAHLYRKPNEAGGHIYYSDECGCETVVWDTAITDESTPMAAIIEEYRRLSEEWRKVQC